MKTDCKYPANTDYYCNFQLIITRLTVLYCTAFLDVIAGSGWLAIERLEDGAVCGGAIKERFLSGMNFCSL